MDVCVNMYLHIVACMYVCKYISEVCVCVCVCVCVEDDACMYVCMCEYIHKCIVMCVRDKDVCVNMYMNIMNVV